MTSVVVNDSCNPEMSSTCYHNAAIERRLFEQTGRQHGKHDFPPPEWIEHKECPHCELTKRMLTWAVNGKTDLRKVDPETEYAFTLTMPPDYTPKKPIEEVARLILTNGLTSKPYERPIKWAYVKEHTEAGTPHIHGVYKTSSGRRIEQKYFKRYWDLWDEKIKLGHGHKGGYHQKARNNECYAAYMEKEGEVFHSPPV